jgi:hypothetical protein
MQFIKISFYILLSLLSSICAVAQGIQFVNKVYEYKPAPGQFINTTLGFPDAAHGIVGEMQGGVSLGAFGGYIVVGFEKPIENDPINPYGIDFTVFGNANQSSSEAAAVYVMSDENENGLPDDTWYLLAGSDYWFSTSLRNYEITYTNPGDTLANDVPWVDNQGNTGVVPANEFHVQTYYPLIDSFPAIPAEKYTLKGARINDRMDKTMQDYITSSPFPFGYADNKPRKNGYSGWEPDNPYTTEIEGTGADGFDISWAIDIDNNYVELSQVDFIKIQTAVNATAGWLGEISTEVLAVVDVEPNGNLTGNDKLVVIEPTKSMLNIGESIDFKAFAFVKGRLEPNKNLSWTTSNEIVATINETGKLDALSEGFCFVYAKWENNDEIADSIKIKVYAPTDIRKAEAGKFYLYPNPAKDYVRLSKNHDFTHYTIYNSVGNRVYESVIYGNLIPLQSLNSGLYFIEFRGKGVSLTKKIIKN